MIPTVVLRSSVFLLSYHTYNNIQIVVVSYIIVAMLGRELIYSGNDERIRFCSNPPYSFVEDSRLKKYQKISLCGCEAEGKSSDLAEVYAMYIQMYATHSYTSQGISISKLAIRTLVLSTCDLLLFWFI